jgi:CheY-like chemotaxis protein
MKAKDEFPKIAPKLTILLADDDEGDCLLFKEALEELPVTAQLVIVHDGEQLMELLAKKTKSLPDVLFLDLNMPRKSGAIALGEIKRDTVLQQLPVIIFSTATEQRNVKQSFRDAAHYYIRKPTKFSELKKVIYKALTLITDKNLFLPGKDNFVITDD